MKKPNPLRCPFWLSALYLHKYHRWIRFLHLQGCQACRVHASEGGCTDSGVPPEFQVKVVGVTCGMHGHAESEDETKRKSKCRRLASRIAFVPQPLKFKASLASLFLSPAMSWGVFLKVIFTSNPSSKASRLQYQCLSCHEGIFGC